MINKSALGAALVLAATTVAACGGRSRRSDPGDSTTTSAGQVATVELDTAQRSRIHVEKVAPETYKASVTTTGKPRASATTTYESTASGQWSPCITGSITWRTAKAAMP